MGPEPMIKTEPIEASFGIIWSFFYWVVGIKKPGCTRGAKVMDAFYFSLVNSSLYFKLT
jgi:hypothetical protein